MANEILDKIQEGNRVKRMRMGQGVADYVTLPSNEEVRFAMVPLLEREIEEAWSAAAMLDTGNNAYGIELRDRTLQAHTLYHALRNPSDPENKVFESPDQLRAELEETDIGFLMEHYRALTAYASPTIDQLTTEDLDELKKAFSTIDLSALSGRQWWHLTQFFMTIAADQLPDRSLLDSFTRTLIGTKDENESIPGA